MLDTDDVLPDEVLAEHLGLDTGTEEDPEPAAEAEEPGFEFEDTPYDEGPEDEDADTDADDAGDYEPDEYEEDDDEVEDVESDEGDDGPSAESDDFLPPDFDRKEIEKHPELEKAYKHMQAAFTRARQRDAAAAKQAQQRAETLEYQVRAFQAQLADDKGAEEFLVQVALSRPEVFERAYEQALKLAEDEGARDLFAREQRVKAAERQAEMARLAAERERQAQRAQEITSTFTELAAEAGLEDPEDLELVERFVVERIHHNRTTNGVADVSEDDIRSAVAEAQRILKRQSKRVERKVSKKLARQRDEAVKAKVRNSRRPAPPRASRAPGVKRKKLPPTPPGVDPLDHTIDTLLGLD